MKDEVEIRKMCEKKYQNRNCEDITTFTESQTEIYINHHNRNDTIYYQTKSDKPSFEIISKAKIERVDFFTYVFGAFGTWLEFSFLVINTVPALFETKTINSHQSNLDVVTRHQLRCSEMKHEGNPAIKKHCFADEE